MKAAIYARSATHDRSRINYQLNQCTQFARSNNYELAPEFIFVDNGRSGAASSERPALQALIAAARTVPRPFDIVVTTETSRLGRCMTIVRKIVERLHGSGVFIRFVSQHSDSRKVFQ